VDRFIHSKLSGQKSYDKLWIVVRMLLIISHGQASVERGFSVNKEVEVVNMHEETYVAQRIICDHLQSIGGLQNVSVGKPLLLAASGARQKYQQHLDEKKASLAADEKTKKRKVNEEQLQQLMAKKQRLECDITALKKSADSFADDAEKKGDLTLLAKSNSLRKTAKEKSVELAGIESNIRKKEIENKNH